MARKQKATGLCGVLALDKPLGMTSHDVVAAVRRITGERRVGHTGTLDPLATGLLLVCVGPATRLADYLMAGVKTYEARICFGASTTTDDSEGEVLCRADVPAQVEDEAFALEVLQGMLGRIEQIPPAFSAIKQNGVVSYKAARKGEALALEPRRVELLGAEVLAVGEDFWEVELVVSKGFYVRSFARDLGEHLSSAAHLGALKRTASGSVSLAQASQLSELTIAQPLPFIDVVEALDLPVVEIDGMQAERVANGMTLTLHAPLPAEQAGEQQSFISIVFKGRLLALYERVGTSMLAKPRVVIPSGVSGV